MVTRRKNISQKAPIVGSQFYVYDLNRLICGSIHFKSMMINFCQPKISSSHMCSGTQNSIRYDRTPPLCDSIGKYSEYMIILLRVRSSIISARFGGVGV